MRKLAIYSLGGLALFTALTGVAHTRTGLRAIAWVTGSDACPFGGEASKLTAAQAEEMRVASLRKQGGSEELAPARPALGFTLDRDVRDDIAGWAAGHKLRCLSDRSGAGLRCLDVAFTALPAPLTTEARGVISFGFDAADRLVSVQLQSATATPRQLVAERAGQAMAGLESLQPGASEGDALDSTRFVHRRATVAFADYHAEVVAANLGDHWMMIETYQSTGSAPVSTASSAPGQVAKR